MAQAEAEKRPNVYLYVPNLIGYSRIIFAFVAFYFAFTNYKYFTFFYLLSQFLDAFDGWAARALNQSSRMGAVLDMVTDRFGDNILLAVLIHLWPQYSMAFISLAVLDYVSHWAQMYSSLLTGNESHKTMNITNPVLRLYYTNKPTLFCVCASQELVYISLYVLAFVPTGSFEAQICMYVFYAMIVPCTFKQYTNCLQLKMACDAMNDWEFEQSKKKK